MDVLIGLAALIAGLAFGGGVGAMLGSEAGQAYRAKVIAQQCEQDGTAVLAIERMRYRVHCTEPAVIAIQPWEE